MPPAHVDRLAIAEVCAVELPVVNVRDVAGGDTGDLRSEADVEPGAPGEILERLEQVLLRVLALLERAQERDLQRLDQDELPARVVEDGAAEVGLLLDGQAGLGHPG